MYNRYIQVASLAQLRPPRLPTPAPDSSLCRAAAPRLCPLRLLLPDCIDPLQTAVPRFRPLQLLLPDCVHFSCCSLLASASAALPRFQQLPDCVRFGCCSPIASSSTAAPRLHPLRLLLPDCIPHLFWKIRAHAQCSRTFFAEFDVQ